MEESPAQPDWGPGAGGAVQRASEPFVFRSGGPFGSGKKAYTIGDAVEYMDRHPDDGIYHLQNETLAKWLADQEADDLASLARRVTTEGYTDQRVMLETFLLGTGLVRRPSLVLRPEKMQMGYILAGQSFSDDLEIKKGRGRGYLFGQLQRVAPCLSLDPTVFSGPSTVVHVSVDTRTLPISSATQEAQISVQSNGSEQAVVVPVSFRVMGVPPRFDRYLIRPLANLAVGGLIGAVLGWLLAESGVGLPDWFPPAQSASAPLVWAGLIGLLWALLAGIRGLLQPLAWPLPFTLGRWLLRTLIWAVTLVLVAAAALWLWQRLHVELGLQAPAVRSSALIGTFAIAIVPGILGELWMTRKVGDPSHAARQMPVVKPGLVIATAVIIGALLLTGVRFAAPYLQKYATEATLVTAQDWTTNQLTGLESTLNRAIDQVYIRMYDRRAPLPPTPTASPKRQPTSTPPPTP